MWHSFYAENPLLWLPLVAMAGFMVAFVAVSVRAWRKTEHADAHMPLDDDRSNA